MAIKLLHTADLHLDRPFWGLGPRRSARRAEMQARFDEILRLAGEHEVDALLVVGDLFDRPAAESGMYVKTCLAQLAARGIKVFLTPGNHDALPGCAFYQGEFPPGVHVFRSPEFEAVEALPGLTVHGLAYSAAGRHRNPLRGRNFAGAGLQIALVHGQLRSAELIGEDYAPIEPAEIAASGLDYLALGHYHTYRDCSAGHTKAYYPGSPHRLDFGDTAERRVLLVELDADRVAVTPIPLRDRPFLQIEGDAGRPEAVYEQLLKVEDPAAYIRLRLSGRAAEPMAGLVADLRDKFADRFFGLEIVEAAVSAAAPESQPGTVVHAFARAMAARLAEAADEETRAVVRLAADYGLLALAGRELP